MSASQVKKTGISPVPMGIFPTMDSLQDVVEYAQTKVPVESKNEMTGILMTYHNTLLKVIDHGKNKHLTEWGTAKETPAYKFDTAMLHAANRANKAQPTLIPISGVGIYRTRSAGGEHTQD